MDRRSNRTRRQWLAVCGGATAGLAGLAGCTSSDDDPDTDNGDGEDEETDETDNGEFTETASGSWPMDRFTADNRMVADDRSGPDGPPEERWTVELEDKEVSGPVVDNGFVYVADETPTLHAIGLSSGETEWTFDGEEPSGGPGVQYAPTTPAVIDDAVYFLTDTLYAIDPEDGKELWSIELGSNDSGDIRVKDNSVYVHNGGELYAIDIDDEAIIWEGEASETQDIAIGEDGTFYVIRRTNSGHDYEVMAFDVFEDEALWTYSPSENVQTGFGLMVQNGTVYTHEEDSVVAIDGEAGTAETIVEYEQTEETTPTDGIAPTIANGTIYSGAAFGYPAVFATDMETGEEPSEWQSEAIEGGPNGLQPFVSDDTLYVWRGYGYGDLNAVNPATGELSWSLDVREHQSMVRGTIPGYSILDDLVVYCVNGNYSVIGTLETT